LLVLKKNNTAIKYIPVYESSKKVDLMPTLLVVKAGSAVRMKEHLISNKEI
jgi:hypothetical protein